MVCELPTHSLWYEQTISCQIESGNFRQVPTALVEGGGFEIRIGWMTLVFLLCQTSALETTGGTVCVASRAVDPFRGQVVPPAGEVSSGGLRLRIDKRPAVPWPQRKSLKIEGLDLSDRHRLVVLDASGKPVESLWLRFSAYKSTDLCMAYDGYQGVGLPEATRPTPWCQGK
jgi:hypothetical protein